jgi:hypothetical protein
LLAPQSSGQRGIRQGNRCDAVPYTKGMELEPFIYLFENYRHSRMGKKDEENYLPARNNKLGITPDSYQLNLKRTRKKRKKKKKKQEGKKIK